MKEVPLSTPVDPAAFARAMDQFGPFAPEPSIAVAVSGGPDSLALTILLQSWAGERGGSVLGLTVDHGLRPDCAAEARQVGAWLSARGVAHRLLRWIGDKSGGGIQEAARRARYALLAEACAESGILHLAIAHHADDQAETVLFRRDRGSSEIGLAGMTASRSLGPVELIRPLLPWPKSALIATCAAHRQDYFNDPSNAEPRFARSGLRQRLAAEPGLREEALSIAGDAAAKRIVAERDIARQLGCCAQVDPHGAIRIDLSAFAPIDPVLRRACLAAIIRTAGGGAHAPAAAALERLGERLAEPGFRGASLGGAALRMARGRLLVCREPGRIGPDVVIAPGDWIGWDDRYRLRLGPREGACVVGKLGYADYARLRRRLRLVLPAVVGAGLPAIREAGRLIAAPSLDWAESGLDRIELGLSPLWPLAAETFTVVYGDVNIMFD